MHSLHTVILNIYTYIYIGPNEKKWEIAREKNAVKMFGGELVKNT